MNVSLNSSYIQNDFISKYGTYASSYDALDALGQPRNKYYQFLSVAALFFMILMVAITQEKIDPNTNKPFPKTTLDTILKYIKYLSIILFIVSLFFNGYKYFAIYVPQYLKWFESLPMDAKAQLVSISTLQSIMNQPTQQNSGLINIRL